jgi:hypothetical protein
VYRYSEFSDNVVNVTLMFARDSSNWDEASLSRMLYYPFVNKRLASLRMCCFRGEDAAWWTNQAKTWIILKGEEDDRRKNSAG